MLLRVGHDRRGRAQLAARFGSACRTDLHRCWCRLGWLRELACRALALRKPMCYLPSPNPAFEPTAASGIRGLAVLSSLRSSAAAQRERWASLAA
jgi:hypothetical protein